MTQIDRREGLGASASRTGLSSLRDGAAARLHPDGLQSTGAADFCECLRRDEALGRMIDATAARDDEAYHRAKADFWRQNP